MIQCEQPVVFDTHIIESEVDARAVSCAGQHVVKHDLRDVYLLTPWKRFPLGRSHVVVLNAFTFPLVEVVSHSVLASILLPCIFR